MFQMSTNSFLVLPISYAFSSVFIIHLRIVYLALFRNTKSKISRKRDSQQFLFFQLKYQKFPFQTNRYDNIKEIVHLITISKILLRSQLLTGLQTMPFALFYFPPLIEHQIYCYIKINQLLQDYMLWAIHTLYTHSTLLSLWRLSFHYLVKAIQIESY